MAKAQAREKENVEIKSKHTESVLIFLTLLSNCKLGG
jgi:hypothetical protein